MYIYVRHELKYNIGCEKRGKDDPRGRIAPLQCRDSSMKKIWDAKRSTPYCTLPYCILFINI